MKNRYRLGLWLAPFVLMLLAACSTPVPFDPDVAGVVEARSGAFQTPVVADLSLAPGSAILYQVQVPSRNSDRDLLYLEVQGTPGVSVTLLSSRGTSLAAANDPRYFGRTRNDLAPLIAGGAPRETEVEPAVVVDFRCVGPCAATRATIGTFYVEIRAPANQIGLVDLYAYLVAEADAHEPNDFSPFATAIAGAGSTSGYLERIGDVDWFRYTGSAPRELRLDSAATPLQPTLTIAGGPTAAAGGVVVVFPGEYFAVASGRNRAAAAGDARYTVTLGATVAGGVLNAERTETPSGVNVSLPGLATRLLLVEVSQAHDLLYVGAGSVGGNLEVRLLARDGNLIAASRSREAFAESLAVLSGTSLGTASFDAASLISYRACPGPCVAVAGGTGVYLLEVSNLSLLSTTANLYAHTVAAQDSNDRGGSHNDTLLRATRLLVGGENFGAIELLDDADFYFYDGVGVRSLTFTAFEPALGLRLRRHNDGVIFGPGDPILLRPGDRFRVYPAAGLAGPASTSGYFLEVSP